MAFLCGITSFARLMINFAVYISMIYYSANPSGCYHLVLLVTALSLSSFLDNGSGGEQLWRTVKPNSNLSSLNQQRVFDQCQPRTKAQQCLLTGYSTLFFPDSAFGVLDLGSDVLFNATLRIKLFLDLPYLRMYGSRSCLGCCTKPPLIIAVDEPSKGLRIRGQTVKKPNILEDFWSTSSLEMDNSAVQSQRSVSSMSTSNPPLDPHNSVGSTSNPTEFVNHGLLLWNQTRQQWIGNKSSQNRPQTRETKLSRNASYDSLLGTNKPFGQTIPLSEMVEFLVDVWEQEGLYD
ncbi:uncharacterized protein LOC127812838 [Diospyros lotus]|uniref:uncharacterized protein LOC127812838 n=1 Tax=Diospyros lotus TaxID=55363 RepID=UPI0022580A7D|nr:uncharacterized protein LOC127812838 [Diospyros lotus]